MGKREKATRARLRTHYHSDLVDDLPDGLEDGEAEARLACASRLMTTAGTLAPRDGANLRDQARRIVRAMPYRRLSDRIDVLRRAGADGDAVAALRERHPQPPGWPPDPASVEQSGRGTWTRVSDPAGKAAGVVTPGRRLFYGLEAERDELLRKAARYDAMWDQLAYSDRGLAEDYRSMAAEARREAEKVSREMEGKS